jgi:hypothetical protein
LGYLGLASWPARAQAQAQAQAAQNYRQDGQNHENLSKNSQKEPKNNVVRSKWGWKGRNAPKIIIKKTGKY